MNIFIDKDDVFLEWYYDVIFINDGEVFIWYSERDGWCYLYKIVKDGSCVVDFMSGEYDIVDLLVVSEKNNVIYFIVFLEDVL